MSRSVAPRGKAAPVVLFYCVPTNGSVSEIRLQRARLVGGEQPRGWLLREPRSLYFVEEEEVPRGGRAPRAGVHVQRS